MTKYMTTASCNLCDAAVWQQLGQWFHIVDTECPGPDKVIIK